MTNRFQSWNARVDEAPMTAAFLAPSAAPHENKESSLRAPSRLKIRRQTSPQIQLSPQNHPNQRQSQHHLQVGCQSQVLYPSGSLWKRKCVEKRRMKRRMCGKMNKYEECIENKRNEELKMIESR